MGKVVRMEEDGMVRIKVISGPQENVTKIYHGSDLMKVKAGTLPVDAAGSTSAG